jgi:hypothetical protein
VRIGAPCWIDHRIGGQGSTVAVILASPTAAAPMKFG